MRTRAGQNTISVCEKLKWPISMIYSTTEDLFWLLRRRKVANLQQLSCFSTSQPINKISSRSIESRLQVCSPSISLERLKLKLKKLRNWEKISFLGWNPEQHPELNQYQYMAKYIEQETGKIIYEQNRRRVLIFNDYFLMTKRQDTKTYLR